MIDTNKHKFFLLQVLKDIYADAALASQLGFKGGTAMMLFHELPRLSVELDFNLTGSGRAADVFDALGEILTGRGTVRDAALKRRGMILVLSYEQGERNLKVEVSTRAYPDEYELKDYLGISMKVMKLEYLFTHKLVALLERNVLTHRDVFDCWFCMNRRVALKQSILNRRLDCSFEEYMERCVAAVDGIPGNRILDGIGELMAPELKTWVRKNLVTDFITLARMYREMKLVE